MHAYACRKLSERKQQAHTSADALAFATPLPWATLCARALALAASDPVRNTFFWKTTFRSPAFRKKSYSCQILTRAGSSGRQLTADASSLPQHPIAPHTSASMHACCLKSLSSVGGASRDQEQGAAPARDSAAALAWADAPDWPGVTDAAGQAGDGATAGMGGGDGADVSVGVGVGTGVSVGVGAGTVGTPGMQGATCTVSMHAVRLKPWHDESGGKHCWQHAHIMNLDMRRDF